MASPSSPHSTPREATARRPARGLRWARIIAASGVFLGLSAALMDFRELVPVRFGHWLAAMQAVPALMGAIAGLGLSAALLGAVVLLTLLFGRVYCSVICPLGVFQDVIGWLARRVGLRRKPLPFSKPHTRLRWSLLGGVVAAAALGWAGLVLALADPYSNYGRIASAFFRPAVTWINNAATGLANKAGLLGVYRVELPLHGLVALAVPAAMLVVVVGLAAWKGRLYCNALCPVGTVLGLLSRKAAFRIAIDSDACTKCGACFRACKAQCIDLKRGEIDFDRCVACFDCVGVCDERGVGYQFFWIRNAGRGDAGAKREDARVAGAEVARRSFLARVLALGAAAFAAKRMFSATVPTVGPAGPIPERGATPESDGKAGLRDIDPARRHAISPPGSGGVRRFLDRCTACHLCVSACPKHVLQPAVFEYGLEGLMRPRMDFTASFCDYDCVKCVDVCPDGALERVPVERKQVEQLGLAYFDPGLCIVTTKGTDCAACSEHCPTKAVYTTPYGNNLRLPTVNRDMCIGCGACEFACPVQPVKAIEVSGLRTHGLARKDAGKQPSPPKPPAEGDFPF